MKLTWFDRLIIKLTLAKNVAAIPFFAGSPALLARAFDEINRLSQSGVEKKHLGTRRGKVVGGFAGDDGCGNTLDIEGIGIVNVYRDPEAS